MFTFEIIGFVGCLFMSGWKMYDVVKNLTNNESIKEDLWWSVLYCFMATLFYVQIAP